MGTRTCGWLGLFFGLASLSLRAEVATYDRIQALKTTPQIDGIISPGEWPEQHAVTLSRAFHPEHSVRLYYAWDATHLYLGAFVEDAQLWADGNGGGAGRYWETSQDDSIEWYFDLNNSGDQVLQPDDRFLALNLGNLTDPENGSGIVSRRSFNKGDGAGSSVGVSYPGVMPAGLVYAVHPYGTVNQPGDTDVGYSVEVAIPWSALPPWQPPQDGEYLRINTIVISDDTGGTRDWTDNRSAEPAALRFTLPILPDEYVELRCGTQSSSQSGVKGPVNYAVLQFQDPADVTPPAAVTGLQAGSIRAQSVQLQWKAPGDNGTQGFCAGFDLRYATAPITEANVAAQAQWPYRDYPGAAGTWVQSRVLGLTPDTDYYFAVRGRDDRGNLGPLVTLGPVHTPALNPAAPALPARGRVGIAPGGRYFLTEDGANFLPVGHHFLLQDSATRHLYDAPVWTGSTLHNFAQESGARKKVTEYLDQLQAHGVTLMRLFLEDFSLNVNGAFSAANGAYWLEYPKGTFNPALRTFLQDLLRLCAERGLYVTLSPFDTYYYDNYLSRTCWHPNGGGPLSDINGFFTNAEVLAMCKARWQWVIEAVQSSGYADAVFGYEVLNEWDSWEWTRADGGDANADAALRAAFMRNLTQYLRGLDSDHLLITCNAALDPRGALADVSYYDTLFDVALPHLYLPGAREPWNNPAAYKPTAVVQQQTRALAWWTLNQLTRRPVLNGEWGPSDGWLPAGFTPTAGATYPPGFSEADDNQLTRVLWFTELCSGAAGPGLRMQGGVRAFDKGLFLSAEMLGVQHTLARFAESGDPAPTFSLRDFASENWRGRLAVAGTAARVLTAGCSDGQKGLVYLHQDKNVTAQTIIGAQLNVAGLSASGGRYAAEFWPTSPDQTAAAASVTAAASGTSVTFPVPAFGEDWAVRWYPTLRPLAPTGLDASAGLYAGAIQLTWSAAEGASTYEVWRSPANDFATAGLLASNLTGVGYADSSTPVNTTYYYWVRAVNAQGGSLSTAAVSGWRAVVDAPAGLAASQGTYLGRVEVAWTAAAGATGYEVWRGRNDDWSGAALLAAPAGAGFSDTNVVTGWTYFYWVRSTQARGLSGFPPPVRGRSMGGGAGWMHLLLGN